MVMPRPVEFPYEPSLIELLRTLAVDGGIVSVPVFIGSDTLTDTTKDWPNGIHKNRLVKIVGVAAAGAGQMAVIADNSKNTLVIKGTWARAIGAGAAYIILEKDLAQILRDVLGSGVDIDIAAKIDEVIAAIIPLEQALIHNAAVVAAADILVAALAPTNTPCRFAIEVAFDVAGIFSVRVTNGAITVGEDFNHGVNLAVNSLFRFSHLVHAGDTINYRYSVNATMLSMRVQEIVSAT